MNYFTITPPISLANYVRFFWVLECELPPDKDYIHRSIADGCSEVLFHYSGQFEEILPGGQQEKSFLSGIHGQSKRVRRFKIKESFGIFGIYFYPYAIPYLFNVPAYEVSNQMLTLDAFLGAEGRNLEEKIMLAQTNDERVNLACNFIQLKLAKQKKDPAPLFEAVKTILFGKGILNRAKLAYDYGLSIRQFERKFKEFSGFTPKLYSRIVRFQSVFDSLKNRELSLTEIAYLCGYYDQSHFISDFKEFSGFNPREFLVKPSTETTIWTS